MSRPAQEAINEAIRQQYEDELKDRVERLAERIFVEAIVPLHVAPRSLLQTVADWSFIAARAFLEQAEKERSR